MGLLIPPVTQNPARPGGVDGVQAPAYLPGYAPEKAGPVAEDDGRADCGGVPGQVEVEAAFDPFRGDGGSGIDADPAASLQPYFGPGMGVRLPNNKIVTHGIEFAPLIADDHARRNAGDPHQSGKTGGNQGV